MSLRTQAHGHVGGASNCPPAPSVVSVCDAGERDLPGLNVKMHKRHQVPAPESHGESPQSPKAGGAHLQVPHPDILLIGRKCQSKLLDRVRDFPGSMCPRGVPPTVQVRKRPPRGRQGQPERTWLTDLSVPWIPSRLAGTQLFTKQGQASERR